MISQDVMIEAKGGFGTNGGSGGIIVMDWGFEVADRQLNAEGGASTNTS